VTVAPEPEGKCPLWSAEQQEPAAEERADWASLLLPAPAPALRGAGLLPLGAACGAPQALPSRAAPPRFMMDGAEPAGAWHQGLAAQVLYRGC
jgi:hypothetical protein